MLKVCENIEFFDFIQTFNAFVPGLASHRITLQDSHIKVTTDHKCFEVLQSHSY